jgi:hypothetical protein
MKIESVDLGEMLEIVPENIQEVNLLSSLAINGYYHIDVQEGSIKIQLMKKAVKWNRK